MKANNEVKRMQQIAGILNEALGVNVISNPIVRDRQATAPKPQAKPASFGVGDFKVQLKVDGKAVMETTADGNPSPEELSDVLSTLQSKYSSKFDFDNAELVVLDPSGKEVGSISTKDSFLKRKATHVGDTYPQTHGTV